MRKHAPSTVAIRRRLTFANVVSLMALFVFPAKRIFGWQ